MRSFAIGVCLFFCGGKYAAGQEALAIKYAGFINHDSLYNHIFYLSSDELAGREIGEHGHQMASEYIKTQYKNAGAVPPSGSSHFQPLRLVKTYWNDIYIRHGDRTYRNVDDGIIYLGDQTLQEEKAFTMDFIGNTIRHGHSDNTFPIYFNTPYWVALKRKHSAKLENSFSVIIDNMNSTDFDSVAAIMHKPFTMSRYGFPTNNPPTDQATSSAFIISKSVAEEIFNIRASKLKRLSSHTGSGVKRIKGFTPVDLHVKAERRHDTLVVDNVLGYIEGSDKKDEVLVISAHFDHLGSANGEVFNGADDNASGISALLEIARVFKKAKEEGNGPRRSILFIAFTGEERGLFGSRYYVQNPVLPLQNTIANLNIDMIGRVDDANTDNPEYIYLIGSDKISLDLHRLSESVNQTYTQLHLDYTYNADDDPNRFYYRSDHYNFARNNIPVIFYFNGAHEDYHQPTDTIDKIDFNILKKRTHLIFHTAWKLANVEERPRVDINAEN